MEIDDQMFARAVGNEFINRQRQLPGEAALPAEGYFGHHSSQGIFDPC